MTNSWTLWRSPVRNDPELATEVITLLDKEMKSARERIKHLVYASFVCHRYIKIAET